jgi:FG-GAP-like repeat/FG-GAP repeat
VGPFGNLNIGIFSSPAAGDLDGDGDADFVTSESFGTGTIHYLENTGDALTPKLIERTGSANPFNGLSAGLTPRLALADLDGDGDLDLLSGENYGNPLHYFENTGNARTPTFVERVGATNPVAGVIGLRGAPTLDDLDGDGDLDLVLGEFTGNFRYFQNTGDARSAVYLEQSGPANPLQGLSVAAGGFATPVLGDLDLDGDADLIAGDEGQGQFHYFENTGTAVTPSFVARTGPENPLDGEDVGLNSSPTLVDLDGDHDLDLVSGEQTGELTAYYLPEPSIVAQLLSGLSALPLLALRTLRLRRG